MVQNSSYYLLVVKRKKLIDELILIFFYVIVSTILDIVFSVIGDRLYRDTITIGKEPRPTFFHPEQVNHPSFVTKGTSDEFT